MELNASDERGIGVIREKVKMFAATSVGASTGVAPFKLIILDEADSLTPDAQAALRRTMETHSRVTRFCIICNYVSRIIEPIASRCSKFRFKPLGTGAMMTRLRSIADAEGVTAGDETLTEVLAVAGGDMRKAITFLQSAAALYGNNVTAEGVIEISGIFPDKETALTLHTVKTGTYEQGRTRAQNIIMMGYGINSVLDKLCDAFLADSEIGADAKATIAEKLATVEKRLIDGADEELQLTDLLAAAQRAVRGVRIDADKARLVII